jgi:hypothetical protein
VARRAGHAAARVRARAAHVEPADRAAVVAVAEDRAGGPQLVEGHVAVHDVAAGEVELALEALGAEHLAAEDRGAETRGVLLDGVDDGVGGRVFLGVPVAAVGQLRGELLAEQAGDVLARRGEAVVDGRGDQHLDDRPPSTSRACFASRKARSM